METAERLVWAADTLGFCSAVKAWGPSNVVSEGRGFDGGGF